MSKPQAAFLSEHRLTNHLPANAVTAWAFLHEHEPWVLPGMGSTPEFNQEERVARSQPSGAVYDVSMVTYRGADGVVREVLATVHEPAVWERVFPC
jgi:hypothetical protein